MKISAVIPTYNHERYLPFALDGALRQTRPLDEIIIVDDGPKDQTRQLVARYGDQVRYIYQDNAGLSAARNAGMRAATGDWVAFLDADDGWLPDKIRWQEEVARRTPAAVLVYNRALFLQPDGSTTLSP